MSSTSTAPVGAWLLLVTGLAAAVVGGCALGSPGLRRSPAPEHAGP